MSKYTVSNAIKVIDKELNASANNTIKVFIGHADEFYMDGSYEKDDDKFVWVQVYNNNISKEIVIGRFATYELCESFAKDFLHDVKIHGEKTKKNIHVLFFN